MKTIKQLFAIFIISLLSLHADAANTQLLFKTNRGQFLVELYPEKAPKTVENFLAYVDAGFYKGTIFHRVINGFMIQGGGFTQNMQEKATRAPIINESNNGLLNEPGTLAMARTNEPHSATSQFFINLQDNMFLNYQLPQDDAIGYCVFGRVLTGMDVVREIAVTPTANKGMHSNVPTSPIIIESVSRVQSN